ncbi:helix-turn-helix domain-containing protein [Pseudoflavitalea sp. G-6-1-2]|uniref:helix-turn-helix domain-containing protein n=1 Tax=Pseudoflavitalea sp. G-6-1-2 TaxID=2728841 RepID=UPI00146AA6C2|nr:XRE family transcriptional regulator [Pseudoflavitalea sp. G-6-1-2]NML23548.1 helix-turn-helix domain-containing protein [Pseudoflavitalea sp. G-6-1-2]
MKEDIIVQISNRLKESRKDKSITLQELADSAGVTKGLLSQIENGRTIPSLQVLLNLIKELKLDLNEFFKDINLHGPESKVLVRRRSDHQAFEKENAIGFHYKRIFSTTIQEHIVDFVILTLDPGCSRPPVETEAFEFKYILSGKVTYTVADQQYDLEAGDSIFFDAAETHNPYNNSKEPVTMLVIYFFKNRK